MELHAAARDGKGQRLQGLRLFIENGVGGGVGRVRRAEFTRVSGGFGLCKYGLA